MHNLRRFYYQNKEKIWKVVLIIAFLLGIIYFMNQKAIEDANNPNLNTLNNSSITYEDNENKTYISGKAPITGGTVTEKDVQKINQTISKFLQYCKNENYQEAYNMLSEDCKEKKYKTLEKFIENYAKAKIDKSKVYEIEEWIGDTYRISISEDKLATGNATDSKKIIEYITIVEEDYQSKLNISGYVGQKNIGKTLTQNNVKITVINRETYMDYEIYKFKVENLSNKTIKVDSFERTNTIYLEDLKGNKYNSYKYELLEDELIILPQLDYEISIKFSNEYSLNRTIDKIIFSSFVLDYDEYLKTPDQKYLTKFTVDI